MPLQAVLAPMQHDRSDSSQGLLLEVERFCEAVMAKERRRKDRLANAGSEAAFRACESRETFQFPLGGRSKESSRKLGRGDLSPST